MVLNVVLRSLWRMLERPRRVVFSMLIVALFVTGVFEMAGMMLIFGFIRGLSASPTGHRPGLGKVFEFFLDRTLSDVEFSVLGGGAVLGLIGVKNAQAMLVRFQLSRFLSNLEHRIALQLFAALVAMPYEGIIRMGGGARLQERLGRTLDVLGVCFRAGTQILADGAVLAMIFGLLAFVDPALTLLGIVVFGGVGMAIYRRMQGRLRRIGRREHEAKVLIGHALDDAFGGLVEMRLRDTREVFMTRYRRALGERLRQERRVDVLARVPAAVNETVLTLAVTTSVLYMVLSERDLGHFLPVLAIFGFAGMRANGALSRMNRSFQALRQRGERFERLLRALERVAPQIFGSSAVEVPTYLVDERPLPPGSDGRLHHQIDLKDVSLRYPGAQTHALRSVSLTVRRGEFVSFCGESGSGKSTLLLVVLGLLRPSKGEVLCDTRSVHDHIRTWQASIGYVGQESYLSHATLRENVAFGVPPSEISDEKVWRALDLAAARSFVELLPDGLDTVISGAVSRLSGGQRQRIIIARALYHDPDIVVFDEATAALDNVTEQEITDAALRLRQEKTVICVAHRLSTIVRSDVIHLMHEGRIVDSGTYADLLDRSERFKKLAKATDA